MDLEHGLKKTLAAAIDKYRMGVTTDFIASLNWTPNNQGQMSLAWNLVFVQASPLIGQKLVQVTICAEPDPSVESLDSLVLAAMDELRTMRARALSVANGGRNDRS